MAMTTAEHMHWGRKLVKSSACDHPVCWKQMSSEAPGKPEPCRNACSHMATFVNHMLQPGLGLVNATPISGNNLNMCRSGVCATIM